MSQTADYLTCNGHKARDNNMRSRDMHGSRLILTGNDIMILLFPLPLPCVIRTTDWLGLPVALDLVLEMGNIAEKF